MSRRSQQSKDAFDVFERQASLPRDLGFLIAAPLQALDVVEEVDGAMLAPGEILHQAHDEAILGFGLDDDGRDLVWPSA